MSWEKVPSSTGRMIEKTLSTRILEGLKKQDTGKSETREIPHISAREDWSRYLHGAQKVIYSCLVRGTKISRAGMFAT